jgi:hypothetical protein
LWMVLIRQEIVLGWYCDYLAQLTQVDIGAEM